MTICIAALCNDGLDPRDSRIVVCADWLRSGPFGKSDTALKVRNLTGPWVLLTAGEETEISVMISAFRAAFKAAVATAPIDETTIKPLVERVLTERKRQKSDELIRSQYAISYDELLRIGKEKFPDSLFRDAVASVRDIQIDADFIVAGFVDDMPLLVETDRHARAHLREEFAVIGEGAYLAQSVLMHRGHAEIHSSVRTLYTVFEAKRYAEGAPTVGKRVVIDMLFSNGSKQKITLDALRWLEATYAALGPKPLNNPMTAPEGKELWATVRDEDDDEPAG